MTSGFPEVRDGGVLRVPAPDADRVEMRFAPILSRDRFDPGEWRHEELSETPDAPGWYEIDLNELDLSDGQYEYEYVVHRGDGEVAAADPFAEELTEFRGRRGVFRIRDGERFSPPFSWDDELPDGVGLPGNEELVIYELPLRWTAPAQDYERDVPDGDFQTLLTEHLDQLADLGVNAIELLPIQDADVTLDWGYGSRFFFAPDLDFGGPVDAKYLVKECHRRGIRVFLDVVPNHATASPLAAVADEWFFLDPEEEPDRPSWGGRRFDFQTAVDGYVPAQEFLCLMAGYWIREYRVDGFRVDEFKGMDDWEFVQRFRDRARAVHDEEFPDRPFLVVAEDSWGRAEIVHERAENPDGRTVVDSMWNFDYRDEARRLLRDEISTEPDEPSRSDRIRALVSGDRTWDDRERAFEDGFDDLVKSVNYLTSHDMGEPGEQRLMNYVFGELVRERGMGDGSVENVRYLVDELVTSEDAVQMAVHDEAVDRVRGAFALLLTSVGIPMFLAGEEFGDIHDLDYTDWQRKMEDPIRWPRAEYPGHEELRASVRDLIHLRTSAEALQRNELELFHAHPEIDDDGGARVFAYCRTGGRSLGETDQVVVVANMGPHDFEGYALPWPWADVDRIEERGRPMRDVDAEFSPDEGEATLSLPPFCVRVFTT